MEENQTRIPPPIKTIKVVIDITPPNGEFGKTDELVKKICEAFQQDYTLRINVKDVFR